MIESIGWCFNWSDVSNIQQCASVQDDWEGREALQRLTIMKYDAAFPVCPLDKDILKSEQSETNNFNET